MMELTITNKKKIMMVLCTLMLLIVFFASAVEAAAQEMDEEFMVIMEQIADDIEEIHHDMHKVVSHLRLISYAGAGIFLVLLSQALIMLKKK